MCQPKKMCAYSFSLRSPDGLNNLGKSGFFLNLNLFNQWHADVSFFIYHITHATMPEMFMLVYVHRGNRLVAPGRVPFLLLRQEESVCYVPTEINM